MAPGMSHCSGGIGHAQHDAMPAIIEWGEKGTTRRRVSAAKLRRASHKNERPAPGRLGNRAFKLRVPHTRPDRKPGLGLAGPYRPQASHVSDDGSYAHPPRPCRNAPRLPGGISMEPPRGIHVTRLPYAWQRCSSRSSMRPERLPRRLSCGHLFPGDLHAEEMHEHLSRRAILRVHLRTANVEINLLGSRIGFAARELLVRHRILDPQRLPVA